MIFVLTQVFAFGHLKEAFEVVAFLRGDADASVDEATKQKQNVRAQLQEIASNQGNQLTDKEIELLMSGTQTLE